MKSLFVLRHAKSSWENAELSDFDRPLNSRGLESIQKIGQELYSFEVKPELILSSPAKRAKHTAILVKESAGFECEIDYQEKIYEASISSLLNLVSEIENKYNSVLIVGHNPGLEGLIRVLTGKIQIMPTATFVKIDLDIENWEHIESNCGNLVFAITPKEIAKTFSS